MTMNIKSQLRVLYERARSPIRYVTAYWGDCWRYFTSTKNTRGVDANIHQLRAKVLKYSHSLEKAFTLPNVTLGFGEHKIRELIECMDQYSAVMCAGKSDVTLRQAITAISTYVEYHKKAGYNIEWVEHIAKHYIAMNDDIRSYTIISKKTYTENAKKSFAEFARSRCSIRTFASQPADVSAIMESISIATKTPSVCNRQAWHVHIVCDKSIKGEILKVQTGNRGFGHAIDKLLVISCSMRAFEGVEERNQAFIDGGMFAMSLLYALHYSKLGCCALNWMVPVRHDVKLRSLLSMDGSNVIVMLLAVGALPDQIVTTQSARRDAKDITTIV